MTQRANIGSVTGHLEQVLQKCSPIVGLLHLGLFIPSDEAWLSDDLTGLLPSSGGVCEVIEGGVLAHSSLQVFCLCRPETQ